jgi:hypothetical protein
LLFPLLSRNFNVFYGLRVPMSYGDSEPFPAFFSSNPISVVEAAVLILCIIVNDITVTSSKLVEKTKPRNVFRLVDENFHFLFPKIKRAFPI